MTFDEFIEYMAWSLHVSVEKALQMWDDLPIGTTVGSFAAGTITKTEQRVAN